MSLVIHASRSRNEAFFRCPRYGYLQYRWGGRGIVKQGKNLFLATGTYAHKGLELIARYLQKHKTGLIPEDSLGGIIQDCKQQYFDYVFPKGEEGGFDLSDETTDEWTKGRRELTDHEKLHLQQYTFDEQTALMEALLRIAAIRLFPRWMEKYKIVTIENDMSFPFVKGEGWEVIQSATVDLVLQELESKDLYLVSYKSYRAFDNRTAKTASHDTQGLSESWAFDEYLKIKQIDKRIMGVKMLYLIKGARKETKRGNGIYEQQSPLIRGYRKLTQDGPEYAHSWFIPKPENDSGWGVIGKAWEKFDVFNGMGLEEVGGVKGWINLLNHGYGPWGNDLEGSLEGQIQPELGDIIGEQIVEPEPYLRHEQDINSWLIQTMYKEREIALKLISNEQQVIGDWRTDSIGYMDTNFPQNRQACHYYPGDHNDCVYLSVCHGTDEERRNPLENGYVYRTPHHKAELIQIEGAK